MLPSLQILHPEHFNFIYLFCGGWGVMCSTGETCGSQFSPSNLCMGDHLGSPRIFQMFKWP